MRIIEITSGIFLIGLAALAVFNFWFPGILLVIGVTGLLWKQLSAKTLSPIALFFLLGGISVWLYNTLVAAGFEIMFPIIMILSGLILIYRLDLKSLFKNDRNSLDS